MKFTIDLWPDLDSNATPQEQLKYAIDSIRRDGENFAWDLADDNGDVIARDVKLNVNEKQVTCIHCGHEIRLDPDNGAGQPVWVHTFRYESTVCHDDPPGSVSDGTVATPPAS